MSDFKIVLDTDGYFMPEGTCEVYYEKTKSITHEGDIYYNTKRELINKTFIEHTDGEGFNHKLEFEVLDHIIKFKDTSSFSRGSFQGFISESRYISKYSDNDCVQWLCMLNRFKLLPNWIKKVYTDSGLHYDAIKETILKEMSVPYVLGTYGYGRKIYCNIDLEYWIESCYKNKCEEYHRTKEFFKRIFEIDLEKDIYNFTTINKLLKNSIQYATN